jgi:hypothetical protein
VSGGRFGLLVRPAPPAKLVTPIRELTTVGTRNHPHRCPRVLTLKWFAEVRRSTHSPHEIYNESDISVRHRHKSCARKC